MVVKILSSAIAVLGAAALTLASLIAVVEGTILAIGVAQLPLRIAAVLADFVLGTILLLGCTYLATHLAVRLVGVGNPEFPPPPIEEFSSEVQSGDKAKI